MDSSAYLEVLSTHCQHIKSIMENASENAMEERFETVFQHCGKITMLVADERHLAQRPVGDTETCDSAYGPLLSVFLSENLLERLQVWCDAQTSAVNDASFAGRVKLEFLHIVETLVGESCTAAMRSHLIVDSRFLSPVSKCLRECESIRLDSVTERQLVATCCQLCTAFHDNVDFLRSVTEPLLEVSQRSFEELQRQQSDDLKVTGAQTLLVLLRTLISYMNHDVSDLAEASRSSLLTMLSLSRSKLRANVPIGDVLLQRTHFCALLAASLSGFFSALPRDLLNATASHVEFASTIDDSVGRCWTRLDEVDTVNCAPLAAFVSAYSFCDAVCGASSGPMRKTLAALVRASFFEPVLMPALLDGALDEVVSSTCLLELCARRTHSRALAHSLVTFVLTAQADGYSVAHALANRLVGASAALTVATLQLYDALFQLPYNEPLVYALVIDPLKRLQTVSIADQSATTTPNNLKDIPSSSGDDDPLSYLQTASRLLHSVVPLCFQLSNADVAAREFVARHCETEFSEYLKDARFAIGTSRDRLLRWRRRMATANDGTATADLDSESESEDESADDKAEAESHNVTANQTMSVTSASELQDATMANKSVEQSDNLSEKSHGTSSKQTQESAAESSVQKASQSPSSSSEADTSGRFARLTNKSTPAARCNTPNNVSRSSSYYTLNFVELELDDDPGESLTSCSKPDLISSKPDLIADPNTQPDLVGDPSSLVDDSGFGELLASTDISMVDIDIDAPQTSMNQLIAELRGVLGEVVPTFGVPTERELRDEAQAKQLQTSELPNYVDEARFDEAFLRRLEEEFGRRRAVRSATERKLTRRMQKNMLLAPLCVVNDASAQNTCNNGPFLNALFWRIESFSENQVAVNLALTGLLVQIASIPHLLVRSFMLKSTASASGPHSKSLLDFLLAAKSKADRLAASHEPLELLRFVADGYQTLLGRVHYHSRRNSSHNSSFEAGLQAFSRQNERRSLRAAGGTLFDLFRGRQGAQRRLSVVADTKAEVQASGNPRFRNYVFALIILKEFVKELAALCIEHALAQIVDVNLEEL